MTTKEFISRITDGTLLDNDIALYASKCVDVRVLLNDLYLAKIALDDITGKRFVKNHKEECLLDNAIGVIEKVFDVHYVEVEEESEDIPLPVELNTEKAQIFFKRAIKTGLITEIKPGTSYKFQGSKTLLSYFCGKIYCDDIVEFDDVERKYILLYTSDRKETKILPQKQLPEEALSKLFGVKNLSQSRHQARKHQIRNYQKVDILDEAAD